MKIVEKRLDELQPYENNPRRNDNAVPYVAESIRRYGFKVPIVIDKNGVIVAGWDFDLLEEELSDIEFGDFDFGFPEPSDIDIDDLFEEHEEAEKEPRTITCPNCGEEIEL